MAQVTTLSSAGLSTPIILNPVAKSTTLMLTVSSCAVATVQLEGTLDDPSTTPAPTVTWAVISSGVAMASSTTLYAVGVVYTILTPLGGVRIQSSVNAAPAVFTLKALQSVSA